MAGTCPPPLGPASRCNNLLGGDRHGQCRLESAGAERRLADRHGRPLQVLGLTGPFRCAGGEPAGLPQLGRDAGLAPNTLDTVARREVLDCVSWKGNGNSRSEGTGGGNHLLWGGPSLEQNPFFGQARLADWNPAVLAASTPSCPICSGNRFGRSGLRSHHRASMKKGSGPAASDHDPGPPQSSAAGGRINANDQRKPCAHPRRYPGVLVADLRRGQRQLKIEASLL